LTVPELKPIHVERWVDSHPEWSPTHQRGCKVAVQRAFHWAERIGVIDRNPIRHLEKPQAGKREQIISPAQYSMILGHYSDRAFLDLIEMAWHTGARPQESIRIEARHVDLGNRRIVLPPKEAKGKKRFRIIYLNDFALQLVRRKIAEQPDGTIFCNLRGTAWKASAVNNRFCRLELSAGAQMPPVRGASNAAILEARIRRITSAAGTQLQELSHGESAQNGPHRRNSLPQGTPLVQPAYRPRTGRRPRDRFPPAAGKRRQSAHRRQRSTARVKCRQSAHRRRPDYPCDAHRL
jgi:integrase